MINTLMPGYKGAAGKTAFALRDTGDKASTGHSGEGCGALGSTAILLKFLGGRGETNERPGQAGVGLLIFPDPAIIVMVLLWCVRSRNDKVAVG